MCKILIISIKMFYNDKIDSLNIKIAYKNKCEKYKSNNNIKFITKKVLYNDCIANKK